MGLQLQGIPKARTLNGRWELDAGYDKVDLVSSKLGVNVLCDLSDIFTVERLSNPSEESLQGKERFKAGGSFTTPHPIPTPSEIVQ